MAKMGRKPKMTEEKVKQLKAICRMKPTLKDCAAYLDVDESTIEKHIKKNFHCRFSEFREQNMVHTRFSLIRTALQQAQSGNTAMLIFCLKNLCGWADKQEVKSTDDNKNTIILNYKLKEKKPNESNKKS